MHSIDIYGCFYTFFRLLDIYFANVMVPLMGRGQSPLPDPTGVGK